MTSRLCDVNVARLLGACLHGEPRYVIVEYPRHGDLVQYLRHHSTTTAAPPGDDDGTEDQLLLMTSRRQRWPNGSVAATPVVLRSDQHPSHHHHHHRIFRPPRLQCKSLLFQSPRLSVVCRPSVCPASDLEN